MSEKEKMSKSELEEVAGGKNRVVRPDSLHENPTIEYTCPKCGCKYTHKNPGKPSVASATMAKCPNCEGGIFREVSWMKEAGKSSE